MPYTLHETMFLPLPRQEVFAFFSDASNLARITPPAMGFKILTPTPIAMEEGTRIDYRVRVAGIPLRWRSLISRWDPPHVFVDEQLAGPYKEWIHTHRFEERDGGTVIDDTVQYQLPLGPLGKLGLWFVRRQLAGIFRFRKQAIEAILLPKS